MCSQGLERHAHLQTAALGEHALGLLDDDPAVQGVLQLLGEQPATESDRCCKMAMVATSARACTTRWSALPRGGWSALNRLSPPMRSSRSRSGTACTERKPRSRAAREKRGHLASAS